MQNMNILILGGTRFIGRYIAAALLEAGHHVTILARGLSPDPLPPEVQRLQGDRSLGAAGLGALGDRHWDVCVDVSGYTPIQVCASAELLQHRVRRYIFVSTVSVYVDGADVPVYETHPLLPPAAEDVTEINGETYGPLKVTCEQIIQAVYGPRCTILRPQVVAGPHDQSGRYPYWVQRAVKGGPMLAPGDGSDYLQVIDVRDIARFTCTVIEHDLGGVFNMAGPRLSWADFMRLLSVAQPVWVPAAMLEAAELTSVELPLFRPDGGPYSSLMNVSNAQARAAGLTLTDPHTTYADVRNWLTEEPVTLALTPEREAALLQQVIQG